KPAVREIRLRGLMGAVELAPPAPGLKWGRRVSAGAVDRGVLLRSIGDDVTLMPPLTITSPELHRIVHALSEAIEDVSPESREARAGPGTRGPSARPPPSGMRAGGALPGRSMRAGPRAP